MYHLNPYNKVHWIINRMAQIRRQADTVQFFEFRVTEENTTRIFKNIGILLLFGAKQIGGRVSNKDLKLKILN